MLMTSRPLSANSRTASLLTRPDAPVITATLILPFTEWWIDLLDVDPHRKFGSSQTLSCRWSKLT